MLYAYHGAQGGDNPAHAANSLSAEEAPRTAPTTPMRSCSPQASIASPRLTPSAPQRAQASLRGRRTDRHPSHSGAEPETRGGLLHRWRLPSLLKDSWEFRKIAKEGSVLPNALCSHDLFGDNKGEVLFVGTTEGFLFIMRPERREPIFTHVVAATISVVLYSPATEQLVLVTLEGHCQVLERLPHLVEQQQPSLGARAEKSSAAPLPCFSFGVAPNICCAEFLATPTSLSLSFNSKATSHTSRNCCIVAGSPDRHLYIYDLAKGQCLLSLYMHHPVTDVKSFLSPLPLRDTPADISATQTAAGEATKPHRSNSAHANPPPSTRLPLVLVATPYTLTLLSADPKEHCRWRAEAERRDVPLTLADTDAIRAMLDTPSAYAEPMCCARRGETHMRRRKQRHRLRFLLSRTVLVEPVWMAKLLDDGAVAVLPQLDVPRLLQEWEDSAAARQRRVRPEKLQRGESKECTMQPDRSDSGSYSRSLTRRCASGRTAPLSPAQRKGTGNMDPNKGLPTSKTRCPLPHTLPRSEVERLGDLSSEERGALQTSASTSTASSAASPLRHRAVSIVSTTTTSSRSSQDFSESPSTTSGRRSSDSSSLSSRSTCSCTTCTRSVPGPEEHRSGSGWSSSYSPRSPISAMTQRTGLMAAGSDSGVSGLHLPMANSRGSTRAPLDRSGETPSLGVSADALTRPEASGTPPLGSFTSGLRRGGLCSPVLAALRTPSSLPSSLTAPLRPMGFSPSASDSPRAPLEETPTSPPPPALCIASAMHLPVSVDVSVGSRRIEILCVEEGGKALVLQAEVVATDTSAAEERRDATGELSARGAALPLDILTPFERSKGMLLRPGGESVSEVRLQVLSPALARSSGSLPGLCSSPVQFSAMASPLSHTRRVIFSSPSSSSVPERETSFTAAQPPNSSFSSLFPAHTAEPRLDGFILNSALAVESATLRDVGRLDISCSWQCDLGVPLVPRARVIPVRDNAFCSILVTSSGCGLVVDSTSCTAIECAVMADCCSFTVTATPCVWDPRPQVSSSRGAALSPALLPESGTETLQPILCSCVSVDAMTLYLMGNVQENVVAPRPEASEDSSLGVGSVLTRLSPLTHEPPSSSARLQCLDKEEASEEWRLLLQLGTLLLEGESRAMEGGGAPRVPVLWNSLQCDGCPRRFASSATPEERVFIARKVLLEECSGLDWEMLHQRAEERPT